MYNSPISNTHPIFENTEFPNIMDIKKIYYGNSRRNLIGI